MSEHAILSPSSGSRWTICTPSARLEAALPERSSTYAEEGTLAHRLSELLIKRKLRRIHEEEFTEQMDAIEIDKYYSAGMLDYCEQFACYVIQVYMTVKKFNRSAQLFTEVKVRMNPIVPESFGTADILIVCDGWTVFIDLKYGQGVPVYAEENKQLLLYALGAMLTFEGVYTFDKVTMSIYQPKLDNISTWEQSAGDIMEWAELELKEQAAEAWAGRGEFAPGTHCQFCLAKPNCRANANYRMQLVEWKFKDAVLLTPEEIATILPMIDGLINWAGAVKEHALKQALAGTYFPGHKLVVGRSNRYITDPQKAIKVLREAKFADDKFLKIELRGITELENKLGKSDFGHYLNDLTRKPIGKPTLVPDKHNGKPYNKIYEAEDIFTNHLNGGDL